MPPRTAAAERALPLKVPARVRPPVGPLTETKPEGGVRAGSGAARTVVAGRAIPIASAVMRRRLLVTLELGALS
jgi:hypothetical protein